MNNNNERSLEYGLRLNNLNTKKEAKKTALKIINSTTDIGQLPYIGCDMLKTLNKNFDFSAFEKSEFFDKLYVIVELFKSTVKELGKFNYIQDNPEYKKHNSILKLKINTLEKDIDALYQNSSLATKEKVKRNFEEIQKEIFVF